MSTWRLLFISSLLLLFFLIGIFLLVPFPLAIFQQLVNSQVYIQRKSDGQYPTATHFWANLPATQWFSFYLFNITNVDEILYEGAPANLVELGPYVFAETEFKDFIDFREDDKQVWFQNNKTWVYHEERSCEKCKYKDVVTLPNAAYMTLITMQVENNMSPLMTLGLDLLAFILGEYPMRTVPIQGVLFESYHDPLVDLSNSNFTKVLMNALGNPIPIPDIPAMGYFPLYNHTNDGDYLIKTGKGNTNDLASIQKWCNMTHLPWWTTKEATDLTGTGDGSFQKPNLQKTDVLRQFQSFTCRMFTLKYQGSEKKINGIPTLGFDMIDNEYDSFLHPGYQYENIEKNDYFPSWPCGLNHTYKPTSLCKSIDCNQLENFCSSCCQGSFVNGTYLLPPGIVPLRCLPGQIKRLPFPGFISPPHFYEAPEQVVNSMRGLHPEREKHRIGSFFINPTTGATVDAFFRLQFNVPIHQQNGFTMSSQLNSAFLPSFWLEVRIELRNYAISYFTFNMVTLPNIILGVGIALVVITVSIFLIGAIWTVKSRRKSNISNHNHSYSDNVTAWSNS